MVTLPVGSGVLRVLAAVRYARPSSVNLVGRESTAIVPSDVADVAARVDPFSLAGHRAPPGRIVTEGGFKSAIRSDGSDCKRLTDGGYDGAVRRMVLAAVALLVLAGCGLIPVQNGPPVPPGPLGPIVPAEGGGPPVECRGVPLDQCRGFASSGEADVVRYIITCTSVCSPEKGDVRIDILGGNGATRSAGNGSYSTGEAVPVPAPPASDPLTPEPAT